MDGNIARRIRSSRTVLPNYRMGRTLGFGAFGKVKLAIHTVTGTKVAIKVIDCRSFDDDEAEKVKREIKIQRLLSHPHVVRLFEVIESHTTIYMVMEYMNSGELFDYILVKGKLEEAEARHFFQQIISGVEYCHFHRVVHRDLKPENLLLDTNRNVKIADFGLGNVTRDGHFLKTSCGSPNYAAPELLSGKFYAGPEVDVWSCGIILYALLCGCVPFDDGILSGLYAKIKRGKYTFPTHLSLGARDLITRILVVDPISRISITEIHKHPWFQQQLPRYVAVRQITELYNTPEVDANIVEEMVQLGCDSFDVVNSLRNGVQNQATVTYYLLLHKRIGVRRNQNNIEFRGSSPDEYTKRPEVYLRSTPQSGTKWALGFKSVSTPHETMTDVLRVFECLNVRWKKIGHYNMKCLWQPQLSTYSRPTIVDASPCTKDVHCHELITKSLSTMNIKSDDALKFEIQLYKASPELFVLDLQRLFGPPLLFLEICAAFFALVVS